MRAFLLPLALSIALALPPTTAWAEGDAAAAPVGADIVKTYDGRVLRGTIIEQDPTGSVSIQLVTGAIRSVPMKDVAYAGPLASEPKPPPPQTPTKVPRPSALPKPHPARVPAPVMTMAATKNPTT